MDMLLFMTRVVNIILSSLVEYVMDNAPPPDKIRSDMLDELETSLEMIGQIDEALSW